jgi:uncharacterized protein (TIRG00374 family)
VLSSSPPTGSHGGWSRRPAAVLFFRVLRIAVAGGLFWLAVRGVEWTRVWDGVAAASWRWLAAAAVLTLIDRMVMAWRWITLLRAIEANRPLQSWALMRVFFVSTFAGTFLPGSVGGDAVRAYAASRQGVTVANAVASVALDRVLGMVSVLLMAVAGLTLVGREVVPQLLPLAVTLALTSLALAALLLFRPGVFARALRWSGAGRFPTVDRLARKFLDAVSQYGSRSGVVATVLGASLVVQLLRVTQVWCLGLALGLTIPVTWYLALVPVIVLIVLLPTSVAGLGTGNAACVYLFAFADVAQEPAFVLSLLFLALSVLGNLPGGILVALDGGLPRAPQREI